MEDQKEAKNNENIEAYEDLQKQENNQSEHEESTPKREEKMFKHEIYDRLPFTYEGVDRFVKIMVGVLIVILIIAIATR